MLPLLRNERGGAALIYVIMISMVLMIFTPVIVMTVSTASLNDEMDRNNKIANNLAVSGMESFISYLNAYSSGSKSRDTYLNEYPKFTNQTPITITLPEGVIAVYSLTKSGPTNSNYSITCTVTAGTGKHARTVTIPYSFDAISTTAINPNNTATPVSNNVFVGGNTNSIPSNLASHNDSSLQQTILDYQTTKISAITNSITSYVNSSTKKTCTANPCKPSDITTLITNNSTIEPLIIYASTLMLKDTDDSAFDRGNGKSLILIVDNMVLGDNNSSWSVVPSITLYGDLIIRQSMSNKAGTLVSIKSVNNNYGDLWMPFDVTLAAGTFGADHSIYANSINNNNPNSINLANVSAPSIVVKGALNQTGTILNATQVVAGSLNVESARLNTTGDILVVGSAKISNSYGDRWGLTSYDAGGYIATGGNLTINLGSTPLTTGGGSTTLVPPASSGSGTGTSNWNPTRL